MNKYEYLNALSNELQNKIPADEYANADTALDLVNATGEIEVDW